MEDLELVCKMPYNKPPYIGVLFQNQFEAERRNQIWVNSYRRDWFKLRLESKDDGLEITLMWGDKAIKDPPYKIKKFDADKLYKFLARTRNTTHFNFGHVISKNDNHIPVRTSVNQVFWVLKVNGIDFKEEY